MADKMLDSVAGPWAGKDRLLAVDQESKTSPARAAASEAAELHKRWLADPTPDNTGALLGSVKDTVESALSSYAGDHKDGLRTRAKLLAVNAFRTYDPTKGTELRTHVYNALQKLYRDRNDRYNLVHIPENVTMEKNSLYAASGAFKGEHGREPTVQELADLTGISMKRQEKISSYKPVSAESQLLNEQGEMLFGAASDPHKVWVDYVYSELDPVNKKIMEWKTGYGGAKQLPTAEIARSLKISAPAVSQRIGTITKRLEEGYNV